MSARLARAWPLVLAALGVGALIWSGYHWLGAPPPQDDDDAEIDGDVAADPAPGAIPPGMHVEKPRPHTIRVAQPYKGRVKASGRIPVRAPRGMLVPVVKILKEAGDVVNKGDPLIEFDREQIEKAIEEARDAGRTDDLRRFESYLDSVVLRSPVDGQVREIWRDVGETPVDDGIPMMTLTDRASWRFVALVPEDAARVATPVGATLEIELEDGLGTVEGTVATLGETADGRSPVGGFVEIVMSLPEHEGYEEDLAGALLVPVSQETACLVPATAIVESRDDEALVRVVDGDGVRDVSVRTAGTEGTDVIVRYGVTPDDAVLVPDPPRR